MNLNRFLVGTGFLFLFAFSLCFVFVSDGLARFYKYTDENGVVHFVDEPGKIPEKFSNQIKSYKEKKDYLTPEEIKALEEKQREEELKKNRRKLLEEEQQKREEFEKKRQEILNRLENRLKQLENHGKLTGDKDTTESTGYTTPVKIYGNTVFVPATIGYDRNEIQANLILDTGANITALHQDIASPLRISEYAESRVRVVGGDLISAKLVHLDYIKVGPHKHESISALIIDSDSTRSGYDGLLGANFLLNYPYTIDHKKSVIRWRQ